MDLFEYIMVLTSILIGLGVAELLGGIVRILRSDFKEGFFLPQFLWAGYLFLFLIITWWSRWDLHENFQWTFLQLILSLMGPILVFILSGLVFPHGERADVYFQRQRKTFFLILPLAPVIGILHEVIIEGTPLISITSLMALTLIVFSLIPRFTRKYWVDVACAAATTIIFLSWVLLMTYEVSA